VGTYKGTVGSGHGKPRKFRLRLWAALPDRLHAELSPPVGGPEVILDAGNGRLSVTLVGERTAYVGAASPEAIAAVTGVRVAIEDLVRWILSGADPGTGEVRVTRRPERGPGLPQELAIVAGERTLRIELREARASGALAAGTGSGAPPPGTEERPIEELPAVETGGEEPGSSEAP
jgi:hypothetical protein